MSHRAPDDVRVRTLLKRAAELVHGHPSEEAVDAFLLRLDVLSEREIVRFASRARSWGAGFGSDDIDRLSSRWRRGARQRLWTVIGLVSADGFTRQAAVEAVQLRRGTAALIAVCCTDWVEQVRAAAIDRLAAAPEAVLLELLPLLEVLTQEHTRAGQLSTLLDLRLSNGDLLAATRSTQPLARRAGWRRLVALDAADPEELIERAARDPDVVVRMLAADQLASFSASERGRVARILIGDPIGTLAAHGLAVLVELDGDPAVVAALTAPSATLRRRARGWAQLRGIDARTIYADRLERAPSDAMALIALAELADPADRALLLHLLVDPRGRVRAAALRAVAGFDPRAARAAALDELTTRGTGRPARIAAAVLAGAQPLGDDVLDQLETVAGDPMRPANQRLRALALVRSSRWRHLVALLDARRMSMPPLRATLDEELGRWLRHSSTITRLPEPAQRARLDALLPTLDDSARRSVEFILRTAR